jgi:dienelactone hydrolase
LEEINGIKTYVATPKVDYPKDKVVLYLTDVFGLDFRITVYVVRIKLINSVLTNPIQLLADDFARNGFKIYAPELFEGDHVPPNAFSTVRLPRWILLSDTRVHKNPVLGNV